MKTNLTRRGFLTGLLASGAATMVPLPRLEAAMNTNGTRFLNGGPIHPRFGLWFFGNGIDPANWHPTGNGGLGSQWSLSPQLAPLAPFKNVLTVLSGFEVKTGGQHVGGSAGATTGAVPDGQGSAQLPSIDQVIADLIGNDTPYRSIEVGLSKATPAGPQPVLHTVSHRGKAAPNYPEYDPHRLFARLFGVSASDPMLAQARKSVLDTVLSDFNALNTQVSSADRQRLEAHAEGIRALERRLVDTPRSCGLLQAPGPDIKEDDREEAPAILNDAMSRMLAMALACDLTNVFSYAFTLPAGHVYYRHLGNDFNRSFHEDIVHLVDAIPNGYDLVTQGVVYAMESFATTLKYLQETPTATGGNLLDEMCVLCTSEVSSGWTHDMQDHPILLVGKACGALKGDMHHVVSGQQNMSQVLMTTANIMGANLTSYGLGVGQTETTVSEILT